MIYLVLWILNIIIVCLVIHFWQKWKHEKTRKEYYKTAYHEAKDEWATQSNAVREKGIECDQLKKENKKLEKDLKDANEQLGHLE
jgi:predicted  nucleic acid-binding Zn-ribbon protein